ncbi:MAG: BspA family leucine-rich repeat surface protein [Marinifilaceae bacterium]|jgi:surface protein|nr:BspA family leucine-rich repeat surface protein [Marinifilaceae bacterium]
MKKTLLCLTICFLTILSFNKLYAEENPLDHLVLKIYTPSDNFDFTLPVNTACQNLFSVDWDNDMVFDNVDVTSNQQHKFSKRGIHIIRIKGQYSPYRLREKVLEVKQWGKVKFKSLENAFLECKYLRITATDSPDLSEVENMSYCFRGCSLAHSNLNNWDVSNITNMKGCFYMVKSHVDISDWDVSSVQDFSHMFDQYYCFNSDISNWNTKSAKDMSYMFNIAGNFNQDISDWNVSNVTNFTCMFYMAGAFNQNLNLWDVSSAVRIEAMFQDAVNFDSPLNKWGSKLLNVTSCQRLFEGAVKFNQDISSWRMPKANGYANMFMKAESFNQDISDWEFGKNNISTQGMFTGAISFNQDLSKWAQYSKNLRYSNSMFTGASSFNQDLSSWDFSNMHIQDILAGTNLSIENYKKLLEKLLETGCQTQEKLVFNSPSNTEIEEIKSSLKSEKDIDVLDLGIGNEDCFITVWKSFASYKKIILKTKSEYQYDFQIKIGDNDWVSYTNLESNEISYNLENDEYTRVMIRGDFPYFQIKNENNSNPVFKFVLQWGDIKWKDFSYSFERTPYVCILSKDAPDLTEVESMVAMFLSANSLMGDFSSWDTSNIVDMDRLFNSAQLTNPNVMGWDVSKVKKMLNMFSSTRFNRDISAWKLNSVENTSYMFFRNMFFNQDLSTWETPNLKYASSMFKESMCFNGGLNKLKVDGVRDFSDMFSYAYSFNQDISSWNTSIAISTNSMFKNASSFNQSIEKLNLSRVTNCISMFENAYSFNQPINKEMFKPKGSYSRLFMCAISFNQSLKGFVREDNTTITEFLYLAYSFNNNLELFEESITRYGNAGDMLFGVSLSLENYKLFLENIETRTTGNRSANVINAYYTNEFKAARDSYMNKIGKFNLVDKGLIGSDPIIEGENIDIITPFNTTVLKSSDFKYYASKSLPIDRIKIVSNLSRGYIYYDTNNNNICDEDNEPKLTANEFIEISQLESGKLKFYSTYDGNESFDFQYCMGSKAVAPYDTGILSDEYTITFIKDYAMPEVSISVDGAIEERDTDYLNSSICILTKNKFYKPIVLGISFSEDDKYEVIDPRYNKENNTLTIPAGRNEYLLRLSIFGDEVDNEIPSFDIDVNLNSADNAELKAEATTLNIVVEDDDFTPIINETEPIEVKESLGLNSYIRKLNIEDNDSHIFTFTPSATDKVKFTSSGYMQIVADNLFDYENPNKPREFEFDVEISDGVNLSTSKLRFKVVDVNDNAPVIKEVDDIELMVTATNGTKLADLEYTDADAEEVNGVFSWTVEPSNLSSIFSVNESNELIIDDVSDLPNVNSYDLVLKLSDGQNTDSENLKISVVKPKITISTTEAARIKEGDETKNYACSIDIESQCSWDVAITFEHTGTAKFGKDYSLGGTNYNSETNTLILPKNTSSVDFNIVILGDVLYSEDKLIKISPVTENANVEENYSFELTVENDDTRPELIVENIYKVSEDFDKSKEVTQFERKNDDTEKEYTFTYAEDNKFFRIDEDGRLFILADVDLDYEGDLKEIPVVFMVSDGTNSNNYSTKIQIEDINDNIPEVIVPDEPIIINQQFELNESLITLLASDKDSDEITNYSQWKIISGNEDGYFTIDPDTGELSMAKQAVESITNDFVLGIQVSDGEFESQIIEVTIRMDIKLAVETIKSQKLDTYIYPNPSREYFIIKSDKYYNSFKLQIIDYTGKIIHTNNNYRINNMEYHNLQAGNYIIRLINKQSTISMKLMVK